MSLRSHLCILVVQAFALIIIVSGTFAQLSHLILHLTQFSASPTATSSSSAPSGSQHSSNTKKVLLPAVIVPTIVLVGALLLTFLGCNMRRRRFRADQLRQQYGTEGRPRRAEDARDIDKDSEVGQ